MIDIMVNVTCAVVIATTALLLINELKKGG